MKPSKRNVQYCFRARRKQLWCILTWKRRIQRRVSSPTAISPPQQHLRYSKRVSRLLSTREWEGTVLVNSFILLLASVYGPPPGKTMFTFIDDLNLPEINAWGDQVSSHNWTPKSMPLTAVHKWVFPSDDWTRRLLQSWEAWRLFHSDGHPGGSIRIFIPKT